MTTLSRVRHYVLERALSALDSRRRRVLAWRALAASQITSLTFERDGITWSLPGLDAYTGFELFVDGGFQVAELRALVNWARHHGVLSPSRNVMLDVGANIGTTCIPFALAPGYVAVAIEPVSSTFGYLKRNVEANNLQDRIVLVNRAVVRAPGRVTMCLVRNHSGGAFVLPETATETSADIAGRETVDGDTLSGIVCAAGIPARAVAFVWADVQGCETAVIESGAAFWQLGVPLWAEIEPLSLRRQGTLDQFTNAATRYFDRFVESRALLKDGIVARTQPMAMLPALIEDVASGSLSTDVLFLPPQFSPA